MDDRRELWNRVRAVLKEQDVDDRTVTFVKEQFYPAVSGLPRLRTAQFKGAVLPPTKPAQIKNMMQYCEAHYPTKIRPVAGKEYRVISGLPVFGDTDARDQVLLITPEGQDTNTLKREVFELGWDAFFAAHPDYEFHRVSQLEKTALGPNFTVHEPTIVFFTYHNGQLYRKSLMAVPAATKGKRYA